jgi:hypothetical protein
LINSQALEYFPLDILQEIATTDDDIKAVRVLKSKIHTKDLYDTSMVKPGMLVSTVNGNGTVTSFHETSLGKSNNCIEVLINNESHYFYAHQLSLIL